MRPEPPAEFVRQLKSMLIGGCPPTAVLVGPWYDQEVEWWGIEAQVPGQGARRIQISQPVIDDTTTDWERMLSGLTTIAREDFSDHRGCTIKVSRSIVDPNDFQFRRDR